MAGRQRRAAARAPLLLDEPGRPVKAGVAVELHVGGPQLALGYLGRAGATAARFRPQPASGIAGPLYATGDLARLNHGGTLTLLGRRDEQVKIRGYRIEPARSRWRWRHCPA